MPSERSAKSASVVPSVVVAMIVAQYKNGLKRGARICAETATAMIAANTPVAAR